MEAHTVSMHFVHAAVAHLSAVARERALAAAGIPAQLLMSNEARVPATSYSKLWLATAKELDDEFFGLDSRSMKVGSFALVCQAVLTCPDVDRALRRTLRAFSVLLDDVRGELHLEGGQAAVRVHNGIRDPNDRRFADETFLVLVHGLICWVAGKRIPLDRVTFSHSRPPYAREYSLMFCEDIGFECPQTTMCFDEKALAAPIAQNAETLARFLRTAPQSVFLKYRNQESWSFRVRRQLRSALHTSGRWQLFEELTAHLGVAAPTLRRRLEAEGTSYRILKDQLRNDMAVEMLCSSRLSVDDIAAQLGFQDSSAFHRAFKRWNGLQPGEYRRRQAHHSSP